MNEPRLPRLTTAQAAARLRVKPATLYAYVSRGLLRSQRAENGGSTFDPLDIEALAGTRRSRPEAGTSSAGASNGTPLMVLESDLTLVDDDGLLFRGVPAVDLAHEYHFEQVANWFWNPAEGMDTVARSDTAARSDTTARFDTPNELIAGIRSAAAALGSEPPLVDVLSMAVLAAGSADPLRQDLSGEAVRAAGRRCIGAMVDGLPGNAPDLDAGAGPRAGTTVAARLASKLKANQPARGNDDVERLVNSALILLLDHDMAASTMAARVAASARSHPYAAIASALGAFNGVLHGSASSAAVDVLRQSMAGTRPEQSISAQLANGRGIPGFGHRIYRQQDPRARQLLAMMRPLPAYEPVLRAVDHVTAVVHARAPHVPNIDLALAALMIGARLQDDAGQVIFAVARTAGWVGHIQDEYTRDPLRLRPMGRYTGPIPS